MVYAEFIENGSKLSIMWSVVVQNSLRSSTAFGMIRWMRELCKKFGIGCAEKWYNHLPSSVCGSEDGSIEIFWDRKLLVGKGIEANKPDLVVVDKVNQKWTFIDFCVP